MILTRAGHTVTVATDLGEHIATCSCGWSADGGRLDVVNAAWMHARRDVEDLITSSPRRSQ